MRGVSIDAAGSVIDIGSYSDSSGHGTCGQLEPTISNSGFSLSRFASHSSAARQKKAFVDTSRHTVIESPHPSPLSAHKGFFGTRPFSRANAALVAGGRDPVDWCIP